MMSSPSFSTFSHKYKDYRQEIRRYLLLLLIPLVFCVILYFAVQGVVTRQIRQGAQDTVQQVYVRTSAMMHEVDMVSSAVFIDIASLNNLSSGEILPYRLEEPASICRQLEIRKGSSTYIKQIYLISEEWQRIFSDAGYFNYNSLESILTRVGTNIPTFEAITEPTWNIQTSNHLTDPYCVMPCRDIHGNTVGRILITLDLTIFMDTLSDLNASFVCLYSDDSLLTSQLLPETYQDIDWHSEKDVSAMLGKPVKCFYVQVDDYTYMAAIERGDYYYPFRVISACFLIYAVVVFLLGFLYLSKVSQERYRQLSDLITALPQDSDDAPTSYQELLPKVQKTLLSLRDRDASERFLSNERALHNILFGQYGASVPASQLEKIGIGPDEPICYIAVFYIRSMDTVALVSSHTDDVNDMAWVIFRSAMAQFAEKRFQYTSCMDPGSYITAFYAPAGDSFGVDVTATCESVCRFMAESYGIHLQAAVSGAAEPQDMPRAFRQSQSLEKFASAIDSDSYIITQDSLDSGGSLLMDGNFIRQEQILLNTLLMEKYDLVPSMVQSILAEHVQPLASDYALAESRLRTVACVLAETLLTTKPAGVDLTACAERLQSADSVSTLNAAVREIYTPLAHAAAEGVRTFREVEQAQEYIMENLADQNLNVTAICEAVGIISQRLTPMFREQLDMGIAEYVNFCRVEQAKKLLTESKLTVKRIGEEVGYSTTDTFTRNFRKLENMTPTEYRQFIGF